jgi:hypothetical protein
MGRPKKEPLSELEVLAKAIGSDGEDLLRELEAADVEELNKRVAQSSQAIHDCKAELEANPNYIKVVEDKKHLSSGFKDVKKRQNAIIKVCLQLRKDRGVA